MSAMIGMRKSGLFDDDFDLDVLVPRNRDADHICPGLGDLVDLVHGRFEIGGLGLRHRLDDHRGSAPDRNPANEYLSLDATPRLLLQGGPSQATEGSLGDA